MSDNVSSAGINFGATDSRMTWYDPRTDSAEVILNAEGEVKTPSLVCFDEGKRSSASRC